MKVLMISIDRGLLGGKQLGDVIERHRQYGEFCQKLDVIVFSPVGFSENKISNKVTVYPTNSKGRLKYFFDSLKIGKKLFAKNHYDLIVTQEPFLTGLLGWRLKKKFGSKLLIHFHGDFWQNPNWLKEQRWNFIFLWLSKFTVPKANAIRVMSSGQREKLVRTGITERKIRVISTPVDLNRFWSQELRIKSQKSNQKIILHVGRDDDVKDYKTLAKAIRLVREKLSDVKFWQIGSHEKIQKEARKEGITLDFHLRLEGLMESNNLIERYYMSDVVVLSSTSESFGKVLVEANACGKPVVSTATTGAQEIVQDGVNGYLVPIGDAQALADKILDLLNNPDKAKEMGENGRKLVKEKYSDNIGKIINFWQDIINNQL